MTFSLFTLEGLNSFATILYFNYLYFFMREAFGFGNKQNLMLAAFLGFIYVFAAWQAGRFGQRYGYLTAVKVGFALMAVSLVAAWMVRSVSGQILAASGVTVGMCFIWPTLEALVSDGAAVARLPDAIGIYNVVWAVTNAVAYFAGGSLIEAFGYEIIFTLPLAMVVLQLALAWWLQRHAAVLARNAVKTAAAPHRPGSPQAAAFLRMAWLANPFAYIAINTLVAVMPGVAAKFQLLPMLAGFVCSIWCFARLAAFVWLWRRTDWHYRFSRLAGSFALLILSFATILMAPDLLALIAAQIIFGGAIGLIYYSSLFYSMDAGEARGEHGGIHEAAIGAGNCAGPAVGALSLQFLPQFANSGAVAVSGLLLCGFGGMLAIWRRANKNRPACPSP